MSLFRFCGYPLLITAVIVGASGCGATLSAGGGGGSGGPGSSIRSASPAAYASPSDLPEPSQGSGSGNPPAQAPVVLTQPSTVTGTVSWPDGQPARNALIDIFPQGYPFGGESGGEAQEATDSTGRYAINGCGTSGCSQLGITFELTDSQNGGNYCYIILYAAGGTYTVNAQSGDVVDWTMADMPCSRNYMRAETAAATIALLKANPSITGGSWEHARQESGG